MKQILFFFFRTTSTTFRACTFRSSLCKWFWQIRYFFQSFLHFLFNFFFWSSLVLRGLSLLFSDAAVCSARKFSITFELVRTSAFRRLRPRFLNSKSRRWLQLQNPRLIYHFEFRCPRSLCCQLKYYCLHMVDPSQQQAKNLQSRRYFC